MQFNAISMFSILFVIMTAHANDWDDGDDFPVVHFDDKPLRPLDALKLQRRNSDPQWLFFVSSELVDSNSTVLQEWEFISHILITPEQCYLIADIIQMLDDALQRANPTVSNITSSAFRLGQEDCDEDDQCPCTDDEQDNRRRVMISHRLLEAKTRSNAPGLKEPSAYPLRVASFSTY